MLLLLQNPAIQCLELHEHVSIYGPELGVAILKTTRKRVKKRNWDEIDTRIHVCAIFVSVVFNTMPCGVVSCSCVKF